MFLSICIFKSSCAVEQVSLVKLEVLFRYLESVLVLVDLSLLRSKPRLGLTKLDVVVDLLLEDIADFLVLGFIVDVTREGVVLNCVHKADWRHI